MVQGNMISVFLVFHLSHCNKIILHSLQLMEATQYETLQPNEIHSLAATRLFDIQKHLSDRMWELRHQIIQQGLKESQYDSMEEEVRMERARKVRRLIQAELIRRKSNSNQKKHNYDEKAFEVEELRNLKPMTTKMLINQRKINKDRETNLFETQKETLQLPKISRQPKFNSFNYEPQQQQSFHTHHNPEMSAPVKNTLQTINYTEAESNISVNQYEKTPLTSIKSSSKNKVKKKKKQISSDMIQLLDRLRVNNGPVMIGKAVHKFVDRKVPETMEVQHSHNDLNRSVQPRTGNQKTSYKNREELLRNMRSRSEKKESQTGNSELSAQAQKKLVEFVRRREKKNISTNHIVQQQPPVEPILQQIQVEQDHEAQKQEGQVKQIAIIKPTQPTWPMENEFLQPLPQNLVIRESIKIEIPTKSIHPEHKKSPKSKITSLRRLRIRNTKESATIN